MHAKLLKLVIITLFLTLVCLTPNNGLASFFGSGVFPKEVNNTCKITWPENSDKYMIAEVQVIVELKNALGEVEEKAYIYLDCKGIPIQGDAIKALQTGSYKTECVGVRISGLDRPKLEAYSVFSIRPNDIEVVTMLKGSKVALRWQGSSVFEIVDDKEFIWTMKSKLSGNTFVGRAVCGEIN